MRIYEYLNGILGALGVGDDNGVPVPSWRIEEYLEAIYEAIRNGGGGGGGGADLTAFLAPQFSSTTAYSAGDYVVKNGDLYKFTEDHAAGAWTGTDVEQTLTATELEALYAALANKANVDGSYSSLTAGNAEQLVSTVGVEDKTPYLFRTTGGSADVGDRVKLSEITGGTVAWNQLVNTGDTSVTVPNGHKYYSRINSVQTIGASTGAAISINDASEDNVFDLTQMFGSTIADYLYTLESGTAGAGVAKLKSWGFCTKPDYAYNAGSLLSVKTSAHKTIGFNAYDNTTGKAKVVGGQA